MSEAPETIWAQETSMGWDEAICTIYRVGHFHEYTRTDLHEAALAAKDAERKAAVQAAYKACAGIADSQAQEFRHCTQDYENGREDAGLSIAAAIRQAAKEGEYMARYSSIAVTLNIWPLMWRRFRHYSDAEGALTYIGPIQIFRIYKCTPPKETPDE